MRRIAPLLACTLVLLGLAVPALAVTTTGIGTFTPLVGSSTQFTTTMQLPATGFPQASVKSSSRSGQVGVQTGATNWFGPNTPVGLKYGSSEGKTYLNLRPKVDSPNGSSLTTYTFQRATPTGWAFVLGDIDADAVTISATKADGSTATAAELGFQSTFNLCDTAPPKPTACSGVVAPFDLPTWDLGTRTLTGNAGAMDTTGAAGWFEPAVSLKTLSFSFQRRAGFPVFQTWFAVKKWDAGGTINAGGSCLPTGTDVRLVDAGGAVVASTEAAADGTYEFLGVAASDGYEVEIGGLPDGCVADSPLRQPINLTSGDGEANFTLRGVIPLPISGTVRDDHGDPIAGVTVSIDDGTNLARTATTGSDGFYLFDTNPVGTYTLSATPPAGYSVAESPSPVPVLVTDTDAKVGNDFILDADPTVGGTVTDSTGGVGAVTVVLLDGGVEVDRTTTAANGTYSFPLVPAGSYTVAVPDPPGGHIEPTPESVTVGTADVTDADLFLARPGLIAGTVTNSGTPVAGAVVTTTGPGSFSEELTTDAEGNYAIGDLLPGAYTVTLALPDGTTSDDPSIDIEIPPGGEDFGAVDFAIADAETPDPGDPGDDGDSEGSGSDSDPLPDTGGPPLLLGPIGLALVGAGSTLVLASRLRGQHRG